MRGLAVFAAILMLTVSLPACGKYGPPERTVPRRERERLPWITPPVPQAPEGTEPVPEERIQEPTDFDDSEAGEEGVE